MSHVQEVKCVVKDLDALTLAAVRVGMELVRDAKKARQYQQVPCDHVIRAASDAESCYELAVVAKPDGTYRLAFDNFGMGGKNLVNRVGKNCDRLTMFYAAEVAKSEAYRQGHTFEETVEQDGSISVLCTA